MSTELLNEEVNYVGQRVNVFVDLQSAQMPGSQPVGVGAGDLSEVETTKGQNSPSGLPIKDHKTHQEPKKTD